MKIYSKEILLDIVDSIYTPLFVLEQVDNLIYANQTFIEKTGLQYDDLLNNGWLKYLKEEDHQYLESLKNEQDVSVRFINKSKAYNVKIRSIKLHSSQLLLCTADFGPEINISQLKNLQQLRAKNIQLQELMQAVVDSTSAIIYAVDVEGRLTIFNKAAFETIKLRKNYEIKLGDKWLDIIDASTGLNREHIQILLDKVLSGESYNTIQQITGQHNTLITYSVKASPIYDSNMQISGATLCAHDISLITKLETENAKKALIRSKELEHANEFYNMVIAVLAHDLRQPFSAIQLTSSLISKKSAKIEELNLEQLMKSLNNTCSKSISLLEGLLHWVKSMKSGYHYKPVRILLHQTIIDSNELFIDQQIGRKIRVVNQIPKNTVIYAHPQMILFICRNIINNATRFSPIGGNITISGLEQGSDYRISISDEGQGMSSEQLDRIFETYYNDNVSSKSGAGIALKVCHDMIKIMNGKISVESEINKGATFHISIPINIIEH